MPTDLAGVASNACGNNFARAQLAQLAQNSSFQLSLDAAGRDEHGDRWYVIHTQPRAEGRAISNLERQGFHIFCPRTRKTVRHARKVMHAFVPLFPNYLLVRLDVSRDHWRSVNGTRGVIRLITQGETPQPVPAGIVEALQARMSTDGAMNWVPSLKIGQAVRISDGPLVNFVGTLEHLDTAGRVRVLLDLLGCSVSVALRCEALMLAA